MAFPAGAIPGVDVSHYNGAVDWAAVQGAGEQYAMMKATEGSQAGGNDMYFADNWAGTSAAGLIRGAYHFFRPAADASIQADIFLQQLAAANGGSATLNPGDLPAIVDIEVSDAVPASNIISGLQIWLDTVGAATGRSPIIYTNANFWIQSVGHVDNFDQYPLWVARYGAAAPTVPETWLRWTFWQFAIQTVPYMSGPVDVDAFNGDMAALRVLAGYSSNVEV